MRNKRRRYDFNVNRRNIGRRHNYPACGNNWGQIKQWIQTVLNLIWSITISKSNPVFNV